jgi:hypothetical protein
MNTTQNTRKLFIAAAASLGVGLGVVLAGCAGSGPPPGASTPASTQSVSPSPTDSPAAKTVREAREVKPFGEAAQTPRGSRMTVFSFEPIDRSKAPPAGSSWYAADIEFCMASNVKSTVPIELIRGDFGMQTESKQLRRPDRAFSAPTEIYSEPGRTIVADECVRGPVAFAVPDDDPARYVGLFIHGGVLRWAVTD